MNDSGHSALGAASGQLDGRFDLVVIGGGITGAGVAWRAAQSGLAVALLEADDFAAGTSSRSSKLIHGGLRYLAQGHVQLVRKAARERRVIHQIAPHLVRPAWMTLPARGSLEMLKYVLGVSAYEVLGGVPANARHRVLKGDSLTDFEPLLNSDAACRYQEFLTDDARLVLAVLRAAVREGAVVHSRVCARGFARDGVDIVVETDSGRVVARHVINCAGPWAATLAPSMRARLVLSKGIHVVVPFERLPARNMLMLAAPDGRPVFVIPNGVVTYIGTTDTLVTGDAELWPSIERHDVEYLLETVALHCSAPALSVADVAAAWAGLRPLVAAPGSRRQTREISRKDEIWHGDDGVVTIAGGKLTGFRLMAENALASVGVRVSAPLRPLPGGDPLNDLEGVLEELTPAARRRLVSLYGSEAPAVLARGQARVGNSERLFIGEVSWAVEVEGAETLEDVVYRRLRLAHLEPFGLEELLPALARVMAPLIGWDRPRERREVAETLARLHSDVAFRGTERPEAA